MPTTSQPRGTSAKPDRVAIFASVGQRRRSLSGIAILALTMGALVAVLAVVLANAVV